MGFFSARHARLRRHLLALYYSRLEPAELVAIARDRRATPLWRLAALRQVMHDAPLEVTRGHCYLVRKRLVREHYHI